MIILRQRFLKVEKKCVIRKRHKKVRILASLLWRVQRSHPGRPTCPRATEDVRVGCLVEETRHLLFRRQSLLPRKARANVSRAFVAEQNRFQCVQRSVADARVQTQLSAKEENTKRNNDSVAPVASWGIALSDSLPRNGSTGLLNEAKQQKGFYQTGCRSEPLHRTCRLNNSTVSEYDIEIVKPLQ